MADEIRVQITADPAKAQQGLRQFDQSAGETAKHLDELGESATTAGENVDELGNTDATPTVDSSAIDDLDDAVGTAQGDVDDLAGTDVAPTSDTSGLDDITDAAGDAQSAVDDVDAAEAAPTSDTSGLDDITDAAGDAQSAVDDVDAAEAAPSSDTSGLDDVSTAASDATTALDDVATAGSNITISTDTGGLADITIDSGDAVSGLGDVGDAAGGVQDDLGGVAEGAGGADSALAGMVGKAVAKIPGVSEVLGPLSRMLGTIVKQALTATPALQATAAAEEEVGASAETAAAGVETAELSLGPMIALLVVAATVIKGLTDAFSDEKEEEQKAFNADQVKMYTTALKGPKDAIHNIADELEKAGEIKFDILGGHAKGDLTAFLAEAGISVEQYAAAISGGAGALDTFTTAVKSTGIATSAQFVIVAAATEAAKNYATAQDNANKFNKVFGETTMSTTDILAKYGAQSQTAAENVAESAETDREARRARDDLKTSTAGVTTGMGLMSDAVEQAKRDLDDANTSTQNMDATYETLMGHIGARDSWRDVQKAILDYATATANGTTNTEAGSDAVDALAKKLGEYVQGLDTIPESEKTQIYADLDKGNVDQVRAMLEDLARTRDARINISVGNSAALNDAVHGHAAGTGDTEDAFIAGENGPELIVGKPHATVFDARKTAEAFAGRGTGGTNVNITNHYWPPGAEPADVVRANRRTERRGLSS